MTGEPGLAEPLYRRAAEIDEREKDTRNLSVDLANLADVLWISGHLREAEAITATQAYRVAWCDGPPYAYHYGLANARKLVQELGAPEPQLSPFDPAKFPPMPDVELNPRDEFYVEPDD